jgi:hypothetical protein
MPSEMLVKDAKTISESDIVKHCSQEIACVAFPVKNHTASKLVYLHSHMDEELEELLIMEAAVFSVAFYSNMCPTAENVHKSTNKCWLISSVLNVNHANCQ